MVILTFATVSKPCPAIVQRAYNHCTFSMVSVSSLVCFDLFVLPLHTTKVLNGENDKRPVDASGHPPDINTDDQTCIANLLTQASKCLKWWGVMAGSSGHVWWGSRIWPSPSTSRTNWYNGGTHTHTTLHVGTQQGRSNAADAARLFRPSTFVRSVGCTKALGVLKTTDRLGPCLVRVWSREFPHLSGYGLAHLTCKPYIPRSGIAVFRHLPRFLNKNNHRPGKPHSLMQPWMIAISYQLPCVFQA